MKNNKVINFRISTELETKMNEVILSLNKNQAGVGITTASFIRMAIQTFINEINLKGLTLEFKRK